MLKGSGLHLGERKLIRRVDELPYFIGPMTRASKASIWRAAVMFLLVATAAPLFAQDPRDFPRPGELEPAIQFWVRVYTEVDTQSGFLHDAENLGVIYTALPLDRKQIETKREAIKAALQVLSTGKRTGLSTEEQQVLALWPANVSNQTLKVASDNVRWQLGQSNSFPCRPISRSGAYRAAYYEEIIVGTKAYLLTQLVDLPHVESSFNPGAYSLAADAAGMWQFTRATGQTIYADRPYRR